VNDLLSLISNIIPVTLAGLILGAGMPALFALALRISAGRTERRPDGAVVQVRRASAAARVLAGVLFGIIVLVILVGVLWIAREYLHQLTGLPILDAG
jgi:hypothetical protein